MWDRERMSCSVHPQDELITDEYNTMSFCARETLTLWSRIFRVSTRVRDCVYPSDVVHSPGCMFAVQKPLRGGDAASKCMMLDVVKLAGTIISTIEYSLSNQLIVLPFTVIMTGSVKWTIGLCGVWLMEMVWLWYHLSLYWLSSCYRNDTHDGRPLYTLLCSYGTFSYHWYHNLMLVTVSTAP